jgi:hypothetical protein
MSSMMLLCKSNRYYLSELAKQNIIDIQKSTRGVGATAVKGSNECTRKRDIEFGGILNME